jgi:AraC-like DNA-binding protein
MSVSILVARALVEAVEGAHFDVSEFLAAARFDPKRLEEVDGRLQQTEYDSLVERALDFTGDGALGLRMGVAAKSLSYSLPVHVVFQAPSLREGLKVAAQYYRLFTDERPWIIEEGAQAVSIKVTGATGSPRCRRFGAEVAVSAIHRMIQHFAPLARPQFAAFEFPAPSHRSEYTLVFGGRERFEQPFTGIVIDPAVMDERQSNRDDELHALLQGQAAKRLAELDRAASYAAKVREYVTTIPERAHDTASIARALGISPRSLRRRLFEEGVTFRDVVERALASLATRLLVDEGKTIQEAANVMSFSEPSAFCRAFKRWTGSTPTQYQSAQMRQRAVSRPLDPSR